MRYQVVYANSDDYKFTDIDHAEALGAPPESFQELMFRNGKKYKDGCYGLGDRSDTHDDLYEFHLMIPETHPMFNIKILDHYIMTIGFDRQLDNKISHFIYELIATYIHA